MSLSVFSSFRLCAYRDQKDHFEDGQDLQNGYILVPEWIHLKTAASCFSVYLQSMSFSKNCVTSMFLTLTNYKHSRVQCLVCFASFTASVNATSIGPACLLIQHFLWCYILSCGCTFFLNRYQKCTESMWTGSISSWSDTSCVITPLLKLLSVMSKGQKKKTPFQIMLLT